MSSSSITFIEKTNPAFTVCDKVVHGTIFSFAVSLILTGTLVSLAASGVPLGSLSHAGAPLGTAFLVTGFAIACVQFGLLISKWV